MTQTKVEQTEATETAAPQVVQMSEEEQQTHRRDMCRILLKTIWPGWTADTPIGRAIVEEFLANAEPAVDELMGKYDFRPRQTGTDDA